MYHDDRAWNSKEKTMIGFSSQLMMSTVVGDTSERSQSHFRYFGLTEDCE
jgi:hypothetical protein